MSELELPEDAVEAAAKAIEAQEKFGTVPRSVMIRAALSAAYPFLVREAQAQALEDAAETSDELASEHSYIGSEASMEALLSLANGLRARAAAIRDGRHD